MLQALRAQSFPRRLLCFPRVVPSSLPVSSRRMPMKCPNNLIPKSRFFLDITHFVDTPRVMLWISTVMCGAVIKFGDGGAIRYEPVYSVSNPLLITIIM